MGSLTLVMVYQDSMPWLKIALESLDHFKNRQPINYVFVSNLPQNDDGSTYVHEFAYEHAATVLIREATKIPYGDSLAHSEALSLAFDTIDTEWTLFMDSDTIVLRDGWLDDLLVTDADMMGSMPDSGLLNYALPILHPCLLLFQTKLARPPYWNKFFGRYNKFQTVDGADWDTCRPFTYHVGIRPDVKQLKLPISKRNDEYGAHTLIMQDSNVIAMHMREGSKAIIRHGEDLRYLKMRSNPYLAWYKGTITPPYNTQSEKRKWQEYS